VCIDNVPGGLCNLFYFLKKKSPCSENADLQVFDAIVCLIQNHITWIAIPTTVDIQVFSPTGFHNR
jgi:hypothetical protein